MRIRGDSIREQQRISNLVFPVCLNLRMQITEKIGLFVKTGIQVEIPMVKNYIGSGVFTYDGYYSAYPVLLHNLPEYGFPSNLNTNVNGNLKIKSLNLSLAFSGGLSLNLGEKMQVILSATFSKSISDIAANEPNTNYRLSSQAHEFRSMMEGSSKPAIQSIGFGIGLRYLLD
jgi:hypothetical protein